MPGRDYKFDRKLNLVGWREKNKSKIRGIKSQARNSMRGRGRIFTCYQS